MKINTVILVTVLAALFSQSGFAQKVKIPFFGNKKCPVTGEKTVAKHFVKHGDEKIYLCCKSCVKKAKKEPKGLFAKAYPTAKNTDVKNAKCPIMGGEAKKAVKTTFQGHVVHFCCPGCDKSFLREPNKHLAKLTSKKKLEDLGNKTCIVMTMEKIKSDSFVIYNNKIINICCPGCADDFAKDPKKYLSAYEKAKKSKRAKKKGHEHSLEGKSGHDQ